MNTQTKLDIKKITVSALLTALAIVIPLMMPIKIKLEPIFSATLAAHVPGILAMFIGPFAVVGTAVGSAIGFFQVLGPWVAARAFMHLVFGLIGCHLIKKNYNIFFIIVVAGLIHAASEMLVGLTSLPFVPLPEGTSAARNILMTVGLGTFIHHCIDFAIVMVIYKPLQAAGVLKTKLTYKSFIGK